MKDGGFNMNPYAELIAKEEAKLEILRKKVASCEQLIAALRGTDTDDIDVAIAKQMGQIPIPIESPASTVDQPSTLIVSGLRVRKDSVSPSVLQFIGLEGKTLDEIESHLITVGKQVTRGTLRTMMMNLRTKYGYVDSPKAGFYKLSDAGAKAIGFDLI